MDIDNFAILINIKSDLNSRSVNIFINITVFRHLEIFLDKFP